MYKFKKLTLIILLNAFAFNHASASDKPMTDEKALEFYRTIHPIYQDGGRISPPFYSTNSKILTHKKLLKFLSFFTNQSKNIVLTAL